MQRVTFSGANVIRPLLPICTILGFVTSVIAQDYPTRPIRIVIPFAPGGVSDLIVRAISEPLSKTWGQGIVADNRGGAGGTLAAGQVARSEPDGYTLMLGVNGNLAVAPSLYKSLPYDPQRDFVPIALAAYGQNVLVVKPDLPTASVKDLLQLAKAKPGQLRYASSGIGAGPHLAAELFKFLGAVEIVHVPYKGSSPMLADLMGGHVDLGFDNIATSLPQVRSGRLKGLAVTGAARSPIAPDLPTIAESGIPNYNYKSFFMLVAPAKTAAPLVERLRGDVNKIVSSADFRSRLSSIGLEPTQLPSNELDALLRQEKALWAKVIEAANIKIE